MLDASGQRVKIFYLVDWKLKVNDSYILHINGITVIHYSIQTFYCQTEKYSDVRIILCFLCYIRKKKKMV